jgi:hypothetical protein
MSFFHSPFPLLVMLSINAGIKYMGQVETRPEYTTYPNNSPRYKPAGPSSTSTAQTTTSTSQSTVPSNNNSPKSDDANSASNANVSNNTILGTLDAMNQDEFNMDVMVTDPKDPLPTEKTKSVSPKLIIRGRSGSKSNGSTSPKKIAKQSFKPIPPLSISEGQPALDLGDDDLPKPTTPKSIPRGSSPRANARSASPNNIFGTLVKAFSVGNVSSTAKSPRGVGDTPKLSKSAESPSILDTEIFFTQVFPLFSIHNHPHHSCWTKEDDKPKKSNGKHVTFALDTNDMETHVLEEQGVEFPKVSNIAIR